MKNIFLTCLFSCLVANSLWASSVVDDLSKKLTLDAFANSSLPEEPGFRFFQTPGESWLIGLRQVFLVHAKPEKVAAVLDTIKEYTGIFSGLKKAEFTEFKSLNEYTVFTETQVDFPFVPNDKTELNYHIDRDAQKILYRYSLRKSNSVKRFDGVIFLVATKSGDTVFFEYDSFEPDLGVAKVAGEEKVWVESALGNLQSDWAVKLRAEHPDWPAAKILEQSEGMLSAGRRQLKKLYGERLLLSIAKILEITP